jgi:transposase
MEVGVTFAHALPDTTSLHLDACYLDEAHAQITLLISSTQAEPRCPGCHVPARYVHSHSTRTLADLPWGGYAITWRLRVRKLFCHNRKCSRREALDGGKGYRVGGGNAQAATSPCSRRDDSGLRGSSPR